MGTLSRGFKGRRRPHLELPPGQYLVEDFPVLSAGPTPDIDLADWELVIASETDEQRRWDWEGFRALPTETVTVDLHRVTHWSKLGTTWAGVSLDTLLEGLDTSAGFALVTSFGGYTTNLPLEDLTGHKAWIAFGYDGQELEPEHGARPGCWSPTCICGRAPSGSGGSSSWTPTSPASGKAWVLTTTATPGRSSGSGATEDRGRHDQLESVDRRHRPRRPLHGIVRVEVTTATGRCTGCGRTAPMTEVRMFDHAPGVVTRGPTCQQVLLLRLVQGPGRAWPDLRGLTYLQLPVPDQT